MKLRIKGDSLRLRVSRSEVAQLLETGRIAETIHFGAAESAMLTYALEHLEARQSLTIRQSPTEIAVVLSTAEARAWAEGERVGVYAEIDAGGRELALAIEKDFACLDGSVEENKDTFPNPNARANC